MREKEFLPAIREKLGIEELNEMQRAMLQTATSTGDVILLSPTGSGKTLAFILPILRLLKEPTGRIQVLVIAPTRELVIQIGSVFSKIAPKYKITLLYGGHKVEDEVNSLSVTPDIVVATPGRLLDHIKRRNIDLLPVRMLVLDEFDKSLELGFDKEMQKIMERLKNVSRKILTSATEIAVMPDYIKFNELRRFSYLLNNENLRSRIRVHKVESSQKDKIDTALQLISDVMPTGNEKTIIFVNYRESAERLASSLRQRGADVGVYHGALDQHDREKALMLFDNGTHPLLVATDLAARGLDIKDVRNIIHYHQPLTEENYTHRNGRTARVNDDGDIYVILSSNEDVKEFISLDDEYYPGEISERFPTPRFSSIYISAGKKEKLSKGDILGFLVKIGGLDAKNIGKINVMDHYSLAAIPKNGLKKFLSAISGAKIKGEKRKITVVK
jgi:superfamily II DNA/RNA helicase